ncbi:hypothetical protein IMW75_11150 [Pseudomonas gregormendelii]|uniref:Uncharacterized protein n=1 Tax=Pseudomonas gregormendelii TaxID=1628277 RepID=A0ABS3AFQ2_9PSED|nr:hypothetical protein [Pseudomonas gregormendelii]MBN3965835.1 hypothetical protein [Pseudomonas gregormendelii]
MDKLLEYCKARYDEELGFKFSLANIFSWLFFVVCIHVGCALKSDNVLLGLSELKVKALIDMSDGVIPSLALTELISSVAFVLFVAWFARKLSEGLFFLFTLKSDFQLLIIDITLIYHGYKYDEAKRVALGLDAKREIERNQKQAKRTRSLAEVFLAASMGILVVLHFTAVNLALGFVCFALFVVVTWRSFHFFISGILPYYVAIKYSAGELLEIKEAFLETSRT